MAVAGKLVNFSLGTDIGGSVRVPAAYCGIFGFRPSHGIIYSEQVIPMAQSFDTIGWFARDLQTLMQVHVLMLSNQVPLSDSFSGTETTQLRPSWIIMGVLAIPTIPGPPPKLLMDPSELENLRARAFSLLSIAGMPGFCQINIPLDMHNILPVSISLLAKHGSDMFHLHVAQELYATLKEQASIAWGSSQICFLDNYYIKLRWI